MELGDIVNVVEQVSGRNFKMEPSGEFLPSANWDVLSHNGDEQVISRQVMYTDWSQGMSRGELQSQYYPYNITTLRSQDRA